ncbi:hypothetical protein BC826DRAFT_740285 [Russula brevipes]|nr:hypothetical protein BC826DRAFT_740285 [Russula brevipes]
MSFTLVRPVPPVPSLSRCIVVHVSYLPVKAHGPLRRQNLPVDTCAICNAVYHLRLPHLLLSSLLHHYSTLTLLLTEHTMTIFHILSSFGNFDVNAALFVLCVHPLCRLRPLLFATLIRRPSSDRRWCMSLPGNLLPTQTTDHHRHSAPPSRSSSSAPMSRHFHLPVRSLPIFVIVCPVSINCTGVVEPSSVFCPMSATLTVPVVLENECARCAWFHAQGPATVGC